MAFLLSQAADGNGSKTRFSLQSIIPRLQRWAPPSHSEGMLVMEMAAGCFSSMAFMAFMTLQTLRCV